MIVNNKELRWLNKQKSSNLQYKGELTDWRFIFTKNMVFFPLALGDGGFWLDGDIIKVYVS